MKNEQQRQERGTPIQRMACGILFLTLDLSVLAASGNGQDKTASPAEQYRALRKEYDRVSSSGVLLTDAERLKFVGRVYKHRNALAEKFLKLAEKHPNDPIALDTLMRVVWQVNTTPWPVELVGEDTVSAKAFDSRRSGTSPQRRRST